MSWCKPVVLHSTGGGIRTPTPRRELDFESGIVSIGRLAVVFVSFIIHGDYGVDKINPFRSCQVPSPLMHY